MKRFALLLLGCAANVAAFAQYKDFSCESGSNFKIIQIDQYDEATVFFLTFTTESGRELISVNDNTKITIGGDYKTYHLQQTGNIPFSSEGCSAYLAKAGDRLNMILQFDRVPIERTFTMTEKDGEEKDDYLFNFKNIKVNMDAVSDKIDINDYLSSCDYIKQERYSVDGKQFMLYNVNGLSVATHLGEEYVDLAKVGRFNIVVTNDSGRPVKLSANNIKVLATKNEKKGWVEIPLWSVSDFDARVSSDNYMTVRGYEDRINPVASAVSRYRNTQINRNSTEDILWAGVEILARASTKSKVDEYADVLEENRAREWDNYLQQVTIESGETYGGYVIFKDKNYKKYKITVTVGGHEYVYYING